MGQRGKCNGKLDIIKLKNPLLESVQSLMSWLFRSHSIKNGIKNMFIFIHHISTIASTFKLQSVKELLMIMTQLFLRLGSKHIMSIF